MTGQYIPDRIKAAARVTGYAAVLGDEPAWLGASAVWAVRLTLAERVGLAWAALRALEPEQAEMVAAAVLGNAGAPLPAFLDPEDDAAGWANWASPAELRAYATACNAVMTPVGRGRAAA